MHAMVTGNALLMTCVFAVKTGKQVIAVKEFVNLVSLTWTHLKEIWICLGLCLVQTILLLTTILSTRMEQQNNFLKWRIQI